MANFYPTHVVNIITWSTAYAVFPMPTFEEHKGYMLKPLSRKYMPALLHKWATRGWEFEQTLWPEEETATHSIQPRRRVGDRYTWTISFDITNFDLSQGSAADVDGCQNNVFEMRKGKGSVYDSDCSHVVPHYHVNVGDTSFR